MPNCPNSYASLHARRPSIQWAGGIGQFISHDKSPLTTRTKANVGWILNPPSHRAKILCGLGGCYTNAHYSYYLISSEVWEIKRLQEQQPDTQQQMERDGDIEQAVITQLKVWNKECNDNDITVWNIRDKCHWYSKCEINVRWRIVKLKCYVNTFKVNDKNSSKRR